MNLSFPGDRIGKLHELSAVFIYAGVLHLLFAPWALRCPGGFAFHSFKSERSAGRIKIKQLGTILLYTYLPFVIFLVSSVCVDSPFH